MNIYFSDFFKIKPELIEVYGAFNISLINDLPLFIDPFLLFGSEKPIYQELHKKIKKYLSFLKSKSYKYEISNGMIKSWYLFPEVKQNWFGYSKVGNNGSGLGMKFGAAFSSSVKKVFDDIDNEEITETSHLEKACLFETGVGRDNVSDFTTNLIKEYLLEYTQSFAESYLSKDMVKKVIVEKVYFNYELERWMPKEFNLPYIFNDYVVLTPKDILTKDDTWINNHDLKGNFERICNSIPNEQLRNEISNYFSKILPPKVDGKNATQKEKSKAIQNTLRRFPEIIKWYIKDKEQNKKEAKNISELKVSEVEQVFVQNMIELVEILTKKSQFYSIKPVSSYEESHKRLIYMKEVIEKNDGYKLFYVNGQPLKREADLQLIYRLTWYASDMDLNREPNNGRGPVDYSASLSKKNKTLIEFKLASNSKLRQNLAKQVEIYEEANQTKDSLKVIMYFDMAEYSKVDKILRELKIRDNENIILIDASQKESASNVKL